MNYEPIKIKASKFRDEMFTHLNQVMTKKQVFLIEKNGIPVAYVSPYNEGTDVLGNKVKNNADIEQVLKNLKGIWADDKDFEKDQKRRKQLELARRKSLEW